MYEDHFRKEGFLSQTAFDVASETRINTSGLRCRVAKEIVLSARFNERSFYPRKSQALHESLRPDHLIQVKQPHVLIYVLAFLDVFCFCNLP